MYHESRRCGSLIEVCKVSLETLVNLNLRKYYQVLSKSCEDCVKYYHKCIFMAFYFIRIFLLLKTHGYMLITKNKYFLSVSKYEVLYLISYNQKEIYEKFCHGALNFLAQAFSKR